MSKRKRAKAPNGSGSVYERPDGSYRASVPVGWLPNGNAKRLTKVFESRKEADAWRMETILARDKGTLIVPKDVTVDELIDLWERSNAHWSVAARDDHMQNLRRHVSPRIGGAQVAKLKPQHVQDLLNRLQVEKRPALREGGAEREPLSDSARHRILQRLKRLLDFGVRMEAVPRNVAAGIKLPSVPPKKRTVWSESELQKALPVLVARDNVYARFLIVGLLTGLRKEELKGLRWRDVNLAGQVLTVAHVVVDEGRLVARERTKTEEGHRTVTFDALTQRTLVAQLDFQKLKGYESPLDLVFTNTARAPLRDKALRAELDAVEALAKVPRLRLYDTRSTHGSVLAARGVNPKVIAQRLGHKDVAFSMATYVRPSDAEHRSVADLVGEIAYVQPCATDGDSPVQDAGDGVAGESN